MDGTQSLRLTIGSLHVIIHTQFANDAQSATKVRIVYIEKDHSREDGCPSVRTAISPQQLM